MVQQLPMHNQILMLQEKRPCFYDHRQSTIKNAHDLGKNVGLDNFIRDKIIYNHYYKPIWKAKAKRNIKFPISSNSFLHKDFKYHTFRETALN